MDNRINKELQEQSDAVELFGYFKKFDAAQLAQMKDRKINNDIEIEKVNERIKDIKDSEVKPLENENKTLLNKIMTKGEHVSEYCYVKYNHLLGAAEYFNVEGEIVYSRALTPDERQLKLEISKAE